MKTYIIISNGKIYRPRLNVNIRGFYKDELIEEIKKDYIDTNAEILCIEDEIEKYHLRESKSNILGLEQEVYDYEIWHNTYINRNLNGFTIPIKVTSNSEYREKLEEILKQYVDHINRPPFVYEKDLLKYINEEIKLILKALDYLIKGENDTADKIILKMLDLFHGDPFLINNLDNSYSFRSIAPFPDLRNDKYENLYSKMMNTDLTFFRVRTKKKNDANTNISDIKHILHLPYDLRAKASSMRFSAAQQPGLYLSTTTFTCSQECNWKKETEDLYASVFIPNEIGKNLKILNLTISEALINGIYNGCSNNNHERPKSLQTSMLKIFPLVIATSFSVNIEEQIKHHYLISQSLMRVANQGGIDGIAYFSMKGDNEFQFPQGVNLAIPATDISSSTPYSEKCKGFEISKPVLYCEQKGNRAKSYINQVNPKCTYFGIESFTSKLKVDGKMQFYGETCYGQFDDFLTSLLRSEN